MAGSLRDVLALQGLFLQGAPTQKGGFGLYSITGIVLHTMGGPVTVVPKVLVKDANWGSWCKRFTKPAP